MWSWLKKIISTEGKKSKPKAKRARTRRGRYKGDDKSTDNYNEAWVGGKAPKRKSKKRKLNKKRKSRKRRK
ncbi:MAG: hypothetical protein H8D84_01565 [Proteobacteria bacterium]|nr:hypothetical protein [Pseudomonadota bacterium]